MTNLPTGTVTFLFSDIEGSIKLAQSNPVAWESVRQRHHTIVRAAVEAQQGHVFQIVGDAFCVAFATAFDALSAAVAAQRALQAEDWGQSPICVRMGLHTGAAEARQSEYYGYLTLAQTQRVMSVARGGQVLISDATHALLAGQMPTELTLRDLGEHRLKGLAHPIQLWQVIAPGLRQDFPPPQSLDAVPNNLPVQLTSFVGREREIADLKRLFAGTRLLTLTGVGGTGKTRLSLQLASNLLEEFKDGVWLVELAPLTDSSLVLSTLATALNIREQPMRPLRETLLDALQGKRVLLLLDNCEHLLDECATLADTLLHVSPQLHLLATSREALGIEGEQVYSIPSLRAPRPSENLSAVELMQFESTQLFVGRARSARANFAINDENAAALAQVCQRLDGIPLAIELAAARVRVMTLAQLADRLDDRFRLLTGGSRTRLPRQQTLLATIEWSWALLPDQERSLFRRVSVFAGGWTLAAAETVCIGYGIELSDVLDLLARLVDKSLVISDELGGEARYRQLETIRQFARDKLMESGEGAAIRGQHVAYYVLMAETIEPQLRGAQQAQAFSRLEREHDNYRAAIDWALEVGDAISGLRLCGALKLFWFTRGYYREGQERVSRALTHSNAQARSRPRARALLAASRLCWAQGEYPQADHFASEALSIATDQNDVLLIVTALDYLSIAARHSGQLTQGREFLEQALLLLRQSGLEREYSAIFFGLGNSAMAERDYETAAGYFSENRRLAVGNSPDSGASVTRLLGHIALHRGNREQARAYYMESVALNRAIGDTAGLMRCVSAFGGLAAAEGQLELAARLLGAVESLLATSHAPPLPTRPG